MARSKRRGGAAVSARAAAWLDRLGGAVLAAVWSLAMRLLGAVAGALERGLALGWRWLAAQRLAVQLVALALPVAIALLVVQRRGPEPPLYVRDEGEALARVIASEAGTLGLQHQLHVAWATRNLANERRQTIAEMACTPCGEQGSARPVSSRQAATDRSRALAALVVTAPALLDPTGGASHYVNPVLQDELARSGRLPGYLGNTYAVVRRRWSQSYGWEPYYRLGPSLEFWGPRRRATVARGDAR